MCIPHPALYGSFLVSQMITWKICFVDYDYPSLSGVGVWSGLLPGPVCASQLLWQVLTSSWEACGRTLRRQQYSQSANTGLTNQIHYERTKQDQLKSTGGLQKPAAKTSLVDARNPLGRWEATKMAP